MRTREGERKREDKENGTQGNARRSLFRRLVTVVERLNRLNTEQATETESKRGVRDGNGERERKIMHFKLHTRRANCTAQSAANTSPIQYLCTSCFELVRFCITTCEQKLSRIDVYSVETYLASQKSPSLTVQY